ncbi:hypothetical protein [Kistimonas asteriae]|uniref:hypothetical protein n=1 Tax=Kistimonas asteriae TaxID=517724 RepID=UPI001BA6F6D3|nr:hypothetical protein [Kistimonas asteriae]
MEKLPLILKRTLFYPLFLLCSMGFYLLEWRGMGAVMVAMLVAGCIHCLVNGYDLWLLKKHSK